MSVSQCPVTESIHFIDDVIGKGGLTHPRSRRIAEEIHSLLDDVAWGVPVTITAGRSGIDPGPAPGRQ